MITNRALENPPTVGAAAAALLSALVAWITDRVDLPADIEAAGSLFVVAVGVYLIGRVTQQFTVPKSWADIP